MIRALVLDLNFAIHGVPATVTVNGTPTPTRVIWLSDQTQGQGGEVERKIGTRFMAIRRDHVPAIPVGSLVTAPPPNSATALNWKVDGYGEQQSDHHRVIVRPV